MKPFDKNYLWFIGLALFFHLIAGICTINVVGNGLGYECNPAPRFLFDTVGIIPTIVFSTLVTILILIYIPYCFKENEHVGLKSAICLSFMIMIMFIDASNDISGLLKINPNLFIDMGLFI